MSKIRSVFLAASATVALNPATAFASGHSEWGGHMHEGWFMGPFMMVLMLIVLVVAVVIVLRLLGWNSADGSGGKTSNALEILEERYARGEIDGEEFREKKQTLSP